MAAGCKNGPNRFRFVRATALVEVAGSAEANSRLTFRRPATLLAERSCRR
jgi:hypothetical protein